MAGLNLVKQLSSKPFALCGKRDRQERRPEAPRLVRELRAAERGAGQGNVACGRKDWSEQWIELKSERR
jgi:hypothetical protein